MHIRLRRYGLYRVLRLRDVGTSHVRVRVVISRVALAIRRGSGVGLLHLLQTTRAKKIAVVLAGSRQLFLHVIQTGERQFRKLRRVRRAIRVRHEAFHTRVRRYHIHPIVFSIKHVHYLQKNHANVAAVQTPRYKFFSPTRKRRSSPFSCDDLSPQGKETKTRANSVHARIANLAPFDLKLVVHAGSKIVHDDHFAVRRESILLLDADPHESLDTGATGDPAGWQRYPSVLAESCAADAVLLQIKVMRSG